MRDIAPLFYFMIVGGAVYNHVCVVSSSLGSASCGGVMVLTVPQGQQSEPSSQPELLYFSMLL